MNATDGNGSQVLESTCTRVWAWRYRSGEESKFFLTYKGELEVSGSKKSSLWRHIHQGLLPVCCESVKFCGWNGIFDRDGCRQTNLIDYVITVRTYTFAYYFQDDVDQHAKDFVVYPYCCLPRLIRMFEETNNIFSSNWVNLRNFYLLGCARVVFCQVGMPLLVYARYLSLSRTIDM